MHSSVLNFIICSISFLSSDDGALHWEEFKTFFADGVLSEEELKNLFNEIDTHNTKYVDIHQNDFVIVVNDITDFDIEHRQKLINYLSFQQH